MPKVVISSLSFLKIRDSAEFGHFALVLYKWRTTRGPSATALDQLMYSVRACLDGLKHLHNVETCFYCPQTFLSLDFQCRDAISELKQMFRGCQELDGLMMVMSCRNG